MEDKELQELFAAKRTTEANRHRQEELRRLMKVESEAAPKSRRLWPVWTGAAAAAVLLFLLVTPLMRQQAERPVMVAQTETIPQTPENADSVMTEWEQPICPQEAVAPVRPAQHIQKRTAIEQIAIAEPMEEPLLAEETPGTIDTFNAENPSPIAQHSSPPAPTVHRRTSSSLACVKGCARPAASSQNLAINLFPKDTVTRAFAFSMK